MTIAKLPLYLFLVCNTFCESNSQIPGKRLHSAVPPKLLQLALRRQKIPVGSVQLATSLNACWTKIQISAIIRPRFTCYLSRLGYTRLGLDGS
jgi:hypothetical protein